LLAFGTGNLTFLPVCLPGRMLKIGVRSARKIVCAKKPSSVEKYTPPGFSIFLHRKKELLPTASITTS